MRLRVGVLGIAVVLAAGACAGTSSPLSVGEPVSGPPPVDLLVFGAGSLAGVLAEAEAGFEATHPGLTVTVATDSSAALATQIEQGAPADVFLAADTTNPQALADAGLAGTPVPFARNELAVIVPADNPAGLASPADLGRPGVKIVAAGDEVPITRYATRLVSNLAALEGYPEGFGEAYAENVVSREDNVKAVVAKIELGEGDAGIVYATDAEGSRRVAILEVPEGANVPASYAGVVVTASPHAAEARSFLDWFAGPEGLAILSAHGFRPAP